MREFIAYRSLTSAPPCCFSSPERCLWGRRAVRWRSIRHVLNAHAIPRPMRTRIQQKVCHGSHRRLHGSVHAASHTEGPLEAGLARRWEWLSCTSPTLCTPDTPSRSHSAVATCTGMASCIVSMWFRLVNGWTGEGTGEGRDVWDVR